VDGLAYRGPRGRRGDEADQPSGTTYDSTREISSPSKVKTVQPANRNSAPTRSFPSPRCGATTVSPSSTSLSTKSLGCPQTGRSRSRRQGLLAAQLPVTVDHPHHIVREEGDDLRGCSRESRRYRSRRCSCVSPPGHVWRHWTSSRIFNSLYETGLADRDVSDLDLVQQRCVRSRRRVGDRQRDDGSGNDLGASTAAAQTSWLRFPHITTRPTSSPA
jgi:hypothetical protein